MQRHALFAAMLTAGLLAACGGGGGDSDTVTPVTPASVAVTGVAAKGLMSDAKVTAHAIKADGSIDETPLGEPVYTDANGNYTLSFPGNAGTPYVVRVQAVNDGGHNTKHLDEATGTEQALPSGFTMRAVITPAAASEGTVTSSASVTPFSELAVAAAAKAEGGLSSANVAQAVTTVTTLLGFDPTTVAVKQTVSADDSAETKKLALMLTAVSKLADDSTLSGSLGCADKSGGEKTQCVVSGLAAAASATSIKLESSSGLNVSALLSDAVTKVIEDPALSTDKGLDASLVETVKDNLACTTNCTAPTPTVADAVSAAKALITQLKSDWTSLFSSGGATATAAGAFNQEVFKFKSVASTVTPAVQMMVTDAGAMALGVAMYRDYTSGTSTQTSRGDSGLGYAKTDGTAMNFTAIGCTLYRVVNADGTLTEVATSPDQVAAIGCRASYFAVGQFDSATATSTTTDWRHGFTILPQADGSFTYTSRARKRVNSCTSGVCTTVTNQALQTNADGTLPDPSAGTITPRTDSAGKVSGALIAGTLPGAFGGDTGRAVVNHHHDVTLDVTVTPGSTGGTVVASGSKVIAYKDATTEIDRVALKTGTVTIVNDDLGNTTGGSMALDIAWTIAPTATANGTEFQGVVNVPAMARDKSGQDLAPTSLEVSGALRNIASGGAVTEFLSGKFTASTSGFAAYDKSLPASATNSYGLTGKFVGTVTAASRPTLEVTINATKRSNATTPTTLDAQYRVLVNGAARSVVSLTTVMNPATSVNSFALNEAASGLKLAWTNTQTTAAQMTKGSDVIGVFQNGVFTFADNSLVSLDLGL